METAEGIVAGGADEKGGRRRTRRIKYVFEYSALRALAGLLHILPIVFSSWVMGAIWRLVAPHLQSIITHAINHVGTPEGVKKSAAVPKKVVVSDKTSSEFGKELLKGIKGSRPQFGQAEDRGEVTRPGKASQKHIDTLMALAAKSKTPPKKK